MLSATAGQPRTGQRSTQLLAAATLDPVVKVEWSVLIDDSAYHLPPEVP